MKGVLALVFSVLFLFTSFNLTGQIEQGGMPYSLKKAFVSEIPEKELPSFDIDDFREKIKRENATRKKLRFAKIFDVHIDILHNASQHNLDNGTLYLYSIKSPGAFSLQVIFSKYNLPEGAKLYIYNPESGHVIGALTAMNNKNSQRLAVSPVKGERVILEYFEPKDVQFEAELEIGQVGHDVLNINQSTGKATAGIGDAGDCNVNVICPEGEGWQDVKQSVARLIAGGYLCTGVLMNNTNFDGRPYMMTANHCIDEESIAQDAVFQFNLESPECDTTYYDGNIQSISGAKLISTAPENKLDFALVELSQPVPVDYNPFFAGWSLDTSNISNTTCIHHPSGDLKKITKDFEPPVTDNYGAGYDLNTHWKVKEWDVGTTEGGSSGSPLFNQHQQVIGDLTGGEASCNNNVNDYYQKFSVSWNAFGEEENQLEYWLDINKTGFQELDGFKPYKNHPSNLRVINSNLTNRLKWNSILEFSTVSNYEVYRNNKKIGTTTRLTFVDEVPAQDSLYFYKVRAYTKSNKYTNFSDSVGVIPVQTVLTPYEYSFENSSFLDSAWYTLHLKGHAKWEIDSSGSELPSDGNNYAYFSGPDSSTAMLVSRKLDLSMGDYILLNYDVLIEENLSKVDELAVYIRYADSLPWKKIQSHDRQTNGWLEESLYLPKPTENYQVMFEAFSGEGAGVCLDDIHIYVDSNAVEPTYSVSEFNICNTDSVLISLDTTNVFNTYNWDMGYGADPRYIEGYGPHEVKYTYPGSKTVTLTINGKYKKVRRDYITVWEIPDPSIIAQGDSLISNYNSGNQWIRDGDTIQGANSPVYIVKQPGTFKLKVTNENGCAAISEEIEIKSVGIDNVKQPGSSYSVYPNPVEEILTIRYEGLEFHSEKQTYRIFNVMGGLVLNGKLRNERQTVSTTGLKPGVYFLRIVSENEGVSVHTFIKE